VTKFRLKIPYNCEEDAICILERIESACYGDDYSLEHSDNFIVVETKNPGLIHLLKVTNPGSY
jgi:hypothetical protein